MYENSKIYNDASKKYLTYRKTSYHSWMTYPCAPNISFAWYKYIQYANNTI
jgi:hypothetical protein